MCASILFCVFDVTVYRVTAPSTEVTGGIWYTQTDFDHGFISSLSEFVRNTVREAGGATLDYILNKLRTSGVRCVYVLRRQHLQHELIVHCSTTVVGSVHACCQAGALRLTLLHLHCNCSASAANESC
jgi:RNA polymerase Rpc34 subunit